MTIVILIKIKNYKNLPPKFYLCGLKNVFNIYTEIVFNIPFLKTIPNIL